VRLAALAVLLALVAAAAPAQAQVDPSITDGSAQRALDAARARWRATGIRSYNFRASVLCFCAQRGPRPLRVRNGRPLHPPGYLREVATVWRMHRLVRRAIDGRAANLEVEYGGRGLPHVIEIDWDAGTADDEFTYTAGRLRPR
jgi:hypothetical protein